MHTSNTAATRRAKRPGKQQAHTVMSMSGSWLMLSAASSAFSTSSRMVVYRHLPGCKARGAIAVG